MTIADTLSLGPLNLPLRYLLFAAAAAFGYGVMSFALRSRAELRRKTGAKLINALLLFIVVWKLEPLVAAFSAGVLRRSLDWSTVWLNLLIPGGEIATIAASVAAALYLIVGAVRERPTGAGSRWLPAAGLVSAILPALLAYFLVATLLEPRTLPTSAGAGERTVAQTGSAIGDLAPRFTTNSLAGGRLSIAQEAGKTVVLNFWASWCPPCRAELPELVSVAAARHHGSVVIWAVNMTSTESSRGEVAQFAREQKIDFPVLLDPTGSIAAAYAVSSLPTTFIISPDGVITAKQIGAMSPGWLRGRLPPEAAR